MKALNDHSFLGRQLGRLAAGVAHPHWFLAAGGAGFISAGLYRPVFEGGLNRDNLVGRTRNIIKITSLPAGVSAAGRSGGGGGKRQSEKNRSSSSDRGQKQWKRICSATFSTSRIWR